MIINFRNVLHFGERASVGEEGVLLHRAKVRATKAPWQQWGAKLFVRLPRSEARNFARKDVGGSNPDADQTADQAKRSASLFARSRLIKIKNKSQTF